MSYGWQPSISFTASKYQVWPVPCHEMFQNLNPIFDLQRYGFVHEKPFLPGERYSVSREMERNVKGYKVIKKVIFSWYQEIAWYADMPKRPKRCNNTLTSGSSPRFDRGPRAGGSTKEGPPVDGQVRTTCWRLVAIQFTRLSYFEESLIFQQWHSNETLFAVSYHDLNMTCSGITSTKLLLNAIRDAVKNVLAEFVR